MAKSELKPVPAVVPAAINLATKRAAICKSCGGFDGVDDAVIEAKWANTPAGDRDELLRVLRGETKTPHAEGMGN